MSLRQSRDTSSASAYENGTIPVNYSGWTTVARNIAMHAALEVDLDADVVVIGAGLTGASTALHLTERKINVVVLEAKQPAAAASGRNAGHVCPTLPRLDGLDHLPGQGRPFVDLFVQNRDIVFELCRKHGIDGDAAKVGYLDVARRDWYRSGLEQRGAQWKALGYDVAVVSGSPLRTLTGTDEYRCGLHWREGGRVNPYLFTNGMIAAAIGLGCKVFGDSAVLACERQGDRWLVRTAKGSVLAQKVILCTNGHFNSNFFPELSRTNYPMTACVLATRPLSASMLKSFNPSRATLSQVPAGLNPVVIDGYRRIITSQIPEPRRAHRGDIYFANFLRFLHRAYPHTRGEQIEMESYWTGRTASSSSEYTREHPKVYEVAPGITALANLGTWGNVMGPLLGMHFSDVLAAERMDQLVFPLERPVQVESRNSLEFKIRHLLVPMARLADRLGLA